MKLFDMGVLAFYTLCGRSERGFLAPIALVNQALTSMTRGLKR